MKLNDHSHCKDELINHSKHQVVTKYSNIRAIKHYSRVIVGLLMISR